MNIFYLSADPVEAAQWMVDKHVVKMIVESAQLLSTAHRVLDGQEIAEKKMVAGSIPVRWRNTKKWKLQDAREPVVYQATHVNHPSCIWTRQSIENYNWLVDHFFALMAEYTHRYNKEHKCFGELSYMLQSPPKNLQEYDWTPMPSAMDDKYKISEDPIDNYRNYYKFGKVNLHHWTNRSAPQWMY